MRKLPFFISNLLLLLVGTFFVACASNGQEIEKIATTEISNGVALSMALVEAARKNEDTQKIEDQLANLSENALAKELHTDDLRKTFWINMYNAYILIFLKKNPERMEEKSKFFKDKQMDIAGTTLSFDDVEHGIIRGSRSKLTLGLMKKWFVGKHERRFRVKKRDGRIHFALNCGAKSCPAVAVYHPERIEEQLEKATFRHLKNTSKYDETTQTAHVTALFSWFRGDFGRKKGVKKWLQKYGVVPKGVSPKLSFNKYDWTLDLDNYVDL